MEPTFAFKPSFLERMTPLQRQSWLQAAEEVMADHQIGYQRALLDGQVSYILNTEEDYIDVCNLSMDIGERALRIEVDTIQSYNLKSDTKVAGNA